MQATARTVGQRSSWCPVKFFSLSAIRLAIRGLYLYFFFFFAISLLVYQLFRQMNGYCIRPSCLAAFSPARILILAVPLASFSGRHLGLIKYHQSRVPLYGAPTACMTMQLVRHSSLQLLIHSGGVQLNPGPDTGSNPVTSYGRRFVSIGHSNVRGLLRR